MLKQFLNNYFGFNKQQRNGIYVLCTISTVLLIIRIAYPYFMKPIDIKVEQIELMEEEIEAKRSNALSNQSNRTFQLFAFDPNTVSYNELIKLGLTERTAATFIKFRSKGFVFKQVSDLKKIYGLNERTFEALEPYVVIKHQSNQYKTVAAKNNKVARSNIKKIELNTADSIMLVELKGVGPAYAKRILKYRSLLGGFTKTEQIKEVYGMTNELFELICSQITINSNAISKFNINSIDFKTLNKHPYVSYEITKQIMNYRKQNKITEQNLMDMLQDEETVNKLKPYLTY
ncbi:MAG: helix-hairpin-helix domain-containing protein [Sphingobacteriaceae bacterium]